MKRVVSLVVLAFCATASMFLCSLVYYAVMGVISWLLRTSWALALVIIFGGSGLLAASTFVLFLLASGTYAASNAICKSEKGLRYRVVGILIAGFYGLSLLGFVIGIMSAPSLTGAIVTDLIFVVYGLCLVIVSYSGK